MSAKNDSSGWLSRLFGGSTSAASSSSAVEEPKTLVSPVLKKRVDDAKSLIKNLSPTTNGSTRIKSIRTLSPPSSIIQRVDKRKFHENGNPPGMEDIFQGTPKRHCPTGNLSLVEEPIRITVPERLDLTWAGDQRIDASPASSVRSLRSRLSGAASTASSGLSSKTRAILQQLEKVHTPAKEVRRLPMMRSATVTSERWNAASAGLSSSFTADPPLRKQRTAVPTRLQLLSTNLGFNKTPYWKDIYRPTMKERDEAVKRKETNGNGSDLDLNGSRLHPLFEVPAAVRSPAKKVEERHHKASMVKGTDGKSRNVFNTRDLEDEEEVNALPLPKPVKMPTISAPKQGFLGELTFQFEKPMERIQANNGEMNKSFEQQESTDESDTTEGDETSSGESTPASSSPEPQEDASPELTLASSQPIQHKEPEPAPKLASIQAPAAKPKWSCSDCFIENDDSATNCACCKAAKGGSGSSQPAAPAILKPTVFVDPVPTGSFSFGFGNSKPAEKTEEKPAEKPLITSSSSSPNLFGQNLAKPVEKPIEIPALPAKTSEQWTCQACFCQSTGTSCVVCQTPKEGAAAPKQERQLVSNISSFASTATPSTALFGFGQSTTVPTEKPTVVKSVTSLLGLTPSTSSPSFGQPKETPAPISFGATPAIPTATSAPIVASIQPEAPKPLFGSPSPLFGATKPDEKIPLFGSPQPLKPSSVIAAPPTTAEAPKLLFGSTAAEAPKSLFGPPSTEPPKPTFGSVPATSPTFLKLEFGASSTTTEAPKSLFGGPTLTTNEAPKLTFGSADPSKVWLTNDTKNGTATVEPPKAPLFGGLSSTTEAPKTQMFGSSTNPPLFGAKTTETPKLAFGTPAAGGLFGNLTTTPAAPSAAPSITTGFGAPSTVAPAIPTFGGASATPSFNSTNSAFTASDAPVAKKPLFGNLNPNDTKVLSAFGQSSSSTNLFGQSNPTAAASTGFNFGAPAAPAFNLGGNAAPSMPTSASAGNLFSAAAPTDFNFGAAPTAGAGQPFVFGSNPPPAQTSLFGTSGPFGGFSSGGPSSSSSGLSQGARKIAQARRRNAGRK